MLAKPVDERRHRLEIDDVDATTDEWKALICEIDHDRRIGQLAVEPGLHGVPVGGENIRRLGGYQCADVARDDLVGHAFPWPVAQHAEGAASGDECADEHRGGKSAPGPSPLGETGRFRHRLDAMPESVGRQVVADIGAHRLSQCPEVGELRGGSWVSSKPRFELARVEGGQARRQDKD